MEKFDSDVMIDITVPYVVHGNDNVSGYTHITINSEADVGEVLTAFGAALRAATFSDDCVRLWLEKHDIEDYLCL